MPHPDRQEGFYYIVDRWKDMSSPVAENFYPGRGGSVLHQLEAIANPP